MKTRIIRYFNQSAQTYNAAAAVQNHIAQRLASHLKNFSAEKILEIGCGTGLLSQHLYSLFPDASFLLTDIAPAMVQTCKERFQQNNQIKTLCLDGEACDLQMSFDLITSSMTLHWFQNFNSSIHKLIDRLSLGGTLAFAMLGENSLYEWSELCEKFNIPVATQEFPRIDSLKESFPGLNIHTETFKHTYESAYDYLKSLKQLGAHASHANHMPVSPGKLRALLRKHNHAVQMTYEVIYGSYTKS